MYEQSGQKSGVKSVGLSNASSCRCGIAKLIPHALHCTVNVLRSSLSPSIGETKNGSRMLSRTVRRSPILNILLYLGSGSSSRMPFVWTSVASVLIASSLSGARNRKSEGGVRDKGDCGPYHFLRTTTLMQSMTHRGCRVPTRIAISRVELSLSRQMLVAGTTNESCAARRKRRRTLWCVDTKGFSKVAVPLLSDGQNR